MQKNITPFPLRRPGLSSTATLRRVEPTCSKCNSAKDCLLEVVEPALRDELSQQIIAASSVKKDGYLYHQGDDMAGIHLLRGGAVKSYLNNESGDEQVVAFHVPGDVLGFDGLVDGRYKTTAIALETVSVCFIPYAQLTSFAGSSPQFWLALMQGAGRRIVEADRLALVLGQQSARCRLANFLINLSERFAARGCSPTAFNLPMGRRDIANYIAVADETLSRLLGEMQRLGAIIVERRLIRICGWKILKAMTIEGLPHAMGSPA